MARARTKQYQFSAYLIGYSIEYRYRDSETESLWKPYLDYVHNYQESPMLSAVAPEFDALCIRYPDRQWRIVEHRAIAQNP